MLVTDNQVIGLHIEHFSEGRWIRPDGAWIVRVGIRSSALLVAVPITDEIESVPAQRSCNLVLAVYRLAFIQVERGSWAVLVGVGVEKSADAVDIHLARKALSSTVRVIASEIAIAA